MLSKKLSTQQNHNQEESITNLEIDSFIAHNKQAFAELLTFIDFVDEKLNIGFIEVNFAKDREILISTLEKHPHCQDVQFAVFNFADPNLRFLRDELVEELNKVTIEPNKKLVIIITGLEKSIGMTGEYPPVLQDLNFIRDDFTTSVPHPILFFLPDYAITRLAKYAPDFWAWRRGLFCFKTTESTKDYALEKTLQSDRSIWNVELPEKQERIDLLERLLMEYNPSNHQETLADIRTHIQILLEIGRAYTSQGEYLKAKHYLNEALKLANTHNDLEQIEASVLHELGKIKANLGQIEDAITNYQQSLELFELIGDIQGKASTLHCLAMLCAKLGEINQAFTYYQQSLKVFDRIGHLQGKASTLHQLAGIYLNQGQIEEAIINYQQSLQIFEQIGDLQGRSATLHNLAIIYADQGQIEEALALLQQSLELDERIGDVQGKAAILHEVGIIYTKQGQIGEALALFQQSLKLKEHIGDVEGKAATLHQIAIIYAHQGQIEEALALFQQSLEIVEHIGDVQGKAMTLWWLGGLARKQGDVKKAREYLQESLEILQRLKSPKAEKVQQMLADVQKLAS